MPPPAFATPSPPTSSAAARTSAPCRNSSAMPTSRPRRAICTQTRGVSRRRLGGWRRRSPAYLPYRRCPPRSVAFFVGNAQLAAPFRRSRGRDGSDHHPMGKTRETGPPMGISRGIACRGALGPDYSLVASQQTAQTSRHAANGGEARDYATWRPNGRHGRTWRARSAAGAGGSSRPRAMTCAESLSAGMPSCTIHVGSRCVMSDSSARLSSSSRAPVP